ncbi:MAG: hypothetical protein MJ178_10035, partial [Treponemataceae bacterium]|nr:hypothetical protein [Treponemataceae bacterium]
MKLNKLAAAGLISLLAMGTAAAQEFDDFDFGMDDFGFGADTGMGSAVEITGVLSADVRAYVADEKTDSLSDMAVKGSADGSLTVRYSGSQADAEIVLKNDPEDVVEEAVLTAYMGNLRLEAGKMKVVWGKGDKLHVIDNCNADDYSDFIYPDYLDRRVATPMVRGSYSFDYAGNLLSNIKLEGVYTPTLPVDRFAESGRWTPAQVQALTGAVTAKATAELKTAVSDLEQARMLA